MAVKRIVIDIAASDTNEAARFYGEILGLDLAMDFGWIVTYTSPEVTQPQLSIATEGGSGTDVPDISIEVDNVDEIHEKVKEAGFEILYDLTDEPWGVRRFYVRDPFGKVINILAHLS